jgi:hypothetical protein
MPRTKTDGLKENIISIFLAIDIIKVACELVAVSHEWDMLYQTLKFRVTFRFFNSDGTVVFSKKYKNAFTTSSKVSTSSL